MPIVVAVLGIIMVGLAVAFFMISSPETDTTAANTELVPNESNPSLDEASSEQNANGSTIDDSTLDTKIDLNTSIKSPGEQSKSEADYTETVTYLTPQRTEQKIAVTLTLKDGVVADANVVYEDGKGQNGFQQRFDGTYKPEVVGKSLANISLSRVGGASLTSKAFNEAVAKISAEAS